MPTISCFAFQPVVLERMPWHDFLSAAQAAGIEQLELGVDGFVETEGMKADELLADATARTTLLRALDDHNLSISALNCIGNPLHPDPEIGARHRSALERTIELAQILEVDRIVAASGCPGTGGATPNWISWPIFWDEWIDSQWEGTVSVWSEIAATASRAGVTIALELHPGMIVYNTSTFLRLEADAKCLAVNLDPSHLWYQGMDPLAVAAALGSHIGFVHAKDTIINEAVVAIDGVVDTSPLTNAARAWTYRAVGVGHGLGWWAEFLSALVAAGYDGPISIEHEDPIVHGAEALQLNAQALRTSMALAGLR
jgi:sugar phosphate isomerase/epimerase